MGSDWKKPATDIKFLLDTILEQIPEAPYVEGTAQMQVASLDFSSYVGRIAIGRVFQG
jgi:GTP-binding protein